MDGTLSSSQEPMTMDKNSAPSAEGAFKAVSAAFDCLSDKQKRNIYDQVGHDAAVEGEKQGGGGGQHHNPFAGFGGMRGGGFGGGGGQQINPEDIFNMFFNGGGGRGGGGMRFNQQQQQQQQRPRNGQQQQRGGNGENQNNLQFLLQFLPIILMLLMMFSSFGSNPSPPTFSFYPSGQYQRKMATSTHGVSTDIEYFVPSNFNSVYKKPQDKARVEKEVETMYRTYLNEKCGNEKVSKQNKQYQARFQGTEAKAKADKMTTPSCEEYQQRFPPRSRYSK